MKAIAIAGAALTLASVVTAEEVKLDPKYVLTPEQVVERRQKMQMKRFGGLVRKEGSASGKVLFLNAQKKVPVSSLKTAFDEIDYSVHPLWEVKDVPSVKLSNPQDEIRAAGGRIGVVLAESPDLPALLVAPEAGWAIVNIAPLAKDADGEKLAHRVRIELLRAFGLAAGASFMARDPMILCPDVATASGLDRIKDGSYGVDARTMIERNIGYYGVVPWKVETYKKACEEGWAPNPTNDVQKKIWDKVRELPTNPIKIKRKKDK